MPTVVVIVAPGPVVVDVTGARGNLEAQKVCAAGTPATSEATAPTTPLHEAAKTENGARKELQSKLRVRTFMSDTGTWSNFGQEADNRAVQFLCEHLLEEATSKAF